MVVMVMVVLIVVVVVMKNGMEKVFLRYRKK